MAKKNCRVCQKPLKCIKGVFGWFLKKDEEAFRSKDMTYKFCNSPEYVYLLKCTKQNKFSL
jgi:hypothetical protein